jgi:cystathionine beta-lyase/cystathionine gamma-synthase
VLEERIARSRAASARSRRRAVRRRCTWRSSRCRRRLHIVASRALYGGSHNLLDYTLPRFGIETTFVDPRDIDAWRAAIRPATRLLFGETLGNPGSMCSTSRAWPSSRTTTGCRCS